MPPVPEKTQIAPNELLSLVDDVGYEFVDGELVERNMGAISSEVGFVIATDLRAYCTAQNLGRVLAETTFQCFPLHPLQWRIPDVAFIAKGKLPDEKLPKGNVTVAPDLAIEVISPNEKVYDLDHKIGDYFEAGTRRVWVVNPEVLSVRVLRPDGSSLELRGDAELSGEDVLPGFVCKISAFFRTI